MEDLALKAKMTNVTVGVQKEGVREIMQIDEKASFRPFNWILKPLCGTIGFAFYSY